MEGSSAATPGERTAQVSPEAPFAMSRALAGANRHFAGPAVVLEALGPAAQDGAAQGRWAALVLDMARQLGWPDAQPRVEASVDRAPGAPGDNHRPRTWLAFAAPAAQLRTAVAVNEWAWVAAAGMVAMARPAHPLGPDPVAHFQAMAAEEQQASRAQAAAPEPVRPRLLVTGSHGKTTVCRLLEAVAREAGSPAAVLELARQPLLEQGLPVADAQVAVVTNVHADRLDEAAVPALDDRAATFLVVAHAVAERGALVMNGDDAAVLRVALGLAHSTAPAWALFSRDHDTPLLDALRRHGGSTCAPREGRLVLVSGGVESDLGAVADMPLGLGGHAAQQVANLAAGALAAALAGWPLDAVRQVLLRFGAAPQDNPGGLWRGAHRGATVLLDRARHGASLSALLKLAGSLGPRRVGLLLGQDARRSDQALAAVARAAASYKPDRVWITEVPAAPGTQVFREAGEVPLVLEQALRGAGLPSRALRHEHDEEAAAHALLAWARPGDVLLLPVHTAGLHERLLALLDTPAA